MSTNVKKLKPSSLLHKSPLASARAPTTNINANLLSLKYAACQFGGTQLHCNELLCSCFKLGFFLSTVNFVRSLDIWLFMIIPLAG
jgi:hypothetical protein